MKSRKPLIGILNLARATFDIPFAESKAEQAWQSLQSIEADIVGTKKLLYDGQALENAVAAFENPKPDLLLIVQATFTDAAATVEFVRRLGIPVVIWSFPEPREGGRLRLNSFCGLNLAAHALGKAEIDFEYLHLPPDSREAVDRISILARAAMAKRRIAESRLLVIGRHPDGFDTCQYDAADLKEWCGATVENMDLSAFLQAVPTIPDQKMMVVRQKLDTQVSNLAEMEEEPLKLSLKVFLALKDTALAKGYDGLAVRCWPEFFTELGCAACGAMSMMNEAGI
ncbi:MAG: fucose isomerase, partial [Proteobacteria bacterium]|nr:fucose isomerase [Pseudomonadota bacterium]